MAKKSGMSLNPGADATLVAAATRAAMANVPKDLSGTFEAMSKSYDDTMKTIGQVYSDAAKSLGKIGGSLVKEAIKNQGNITAGDPHVLETQIEVQGPQTEENAGAPGGLITTDTSDDPKPRKKITKKTTIGDELRDIRSELFSLSLKTDKKSRMRKNELRAERAQFTSDIAFLDNARKVTDGQLKSGNVNFETTGKLNLAFKQGMNALTTKTGVIADGEFKGYKLVPTRDDNGKMAFMMRDNLGNLVTGKDELGNPTTQGNEPYIVPASETSTLLEMKADQKIIDPINKKITGLFKTGQTGLPYLGNQLVNSMRPALDDEATLRQLSDVRLGDDTKTLRDHVSSPSDYSAEIFAGLSTVDLAGMGVDEMADGRAGITKQDFIGSDVAVINFNKVKSATFDKDNPNYDSGSHLKALTESHIYKTGETMHLAGAKLYVAPKGTGTETSNPFGTKSIAFVPETGSTQYKTPAQAEADRDAILNGIRFSSIYGDYEPAQGGFNLEGQFISTYDVLTQEKVNLTGDRPAEGSVTTKPTYNASDFEKLGGSETDDKALVKKFRDKYPKFKFGATSMDFGDKVEVTHKESGTTTKIPVSPTFYTDLANFMNNPKKKLI